MKNTRRTAAVVASAAMLSCFGAGTAAAADRAEAPTKVASAHDTKGSVDAVFEMKAPILADPNAFRVVDTMPQGAKATVSTERFHGLEMDCGLLGKSEWWRKIDKPAQDTYRNAASNSSDEGP